MAEVLLFHHAQGLTGGIHSFADYLRAAGHVVHTPDLYEGRTFETVEDGVAHAQQVGFQTILDRGVRAADALSDKLVYGGISLGVMPAQKLAQTRPGAKGAVLVSACIPVAEFGVWPEGVRAQIHMMDRDKWIEEGDLEAARQLTQSVPGTEMFLYPGERHLFVDSSLPDYDETAAQSLKERVRRFLVVATVT